MIPNTHKDYYGDETRWFVGTVKSLNDPLELGRVKVRIFGVHSENTADVPDGELPRYKPRYKTPSTGLGYILRWKKFTITFSSWFYTSIREAYQSGLLE